MKRGKCLHRIRLGSYTKSMIMPTGRPAALWLRALLVGKRHSVFIIILLSVKVQKYALPSNSKRYIALSDNELRFLFRHTCYLLDSIKYSCNKVEHVDSYYCVLMRRENQVWDYCAKGFHPNRKVEHSPASTSIWWAKLEIYSSTITFMCWKVFEVFHIKTYAHYRFKAG
jgi:hypothetical protein